MYKNYIEIREGMGEKVWSVARDDKLSLL